MEVGGWRCGGGEVDVWRWRCGGVGVGRWRCGGGGVEVGSIDKSSCPISYTTKSN